MKRLILIPVLLASSLPAFANCYVLKNETSSPQTFRFKLSHAIPGLPPFITIAPRSQYPKKGTWCWNRPPEYYGLATPDPGSYIPSWQGPLILGNRGRASASGTYVLRALPNHQEVAGWSRPLGPQVSVRPMADGRRRFPNAIS